MADFEIRDQNGRVIGAGSGDREWIDKTLADWRERGLVDESSAPRPELKVIEGGRARSAPSPKEVP